ncbi:hypothetical protein AKJ09_09700 [Labilithrix luteola]|uniref:Lipid/polyisoprenoid-binding YceI-like domain-containing protein n=1 Tax=Labilithrix luteola TaxID=1391654 RepID=A0A0K1QBJ1_9BACT|nr:hypothetical protein [Labilithrix luteola]AKV03037.1 hypothetical protein AKJ09_09700 [Labilithrix luteola]
MVVLVALGALGCQEKAKTDLAPAASSLAPSTAPKPAAALKFTIDPKSTSSIDMPAPKEHIKAATDAALGALDIDLTNLANTRGEVKVDLASLVTKTFDDAAKDKTQTAHARTWLEVADGEEGKLPDDVKKANQFAVYAIRTIDNVSASDLTKVPVTKDGTDEVRTVTMTTHGELLVHGHKVDRDAEVEAKFVYAPGAPADKPKAVLVKTKKPLRVVLGEHDVKPRDGFGKIAKGAFNLLGTKVADTADISLDLRALPQS